MKFLNSKIIFADFNSAKSLVGQADVYSNLLTSFDIQAKVKYIGEPNVKKYLLNAQKYLYSWLGYEIEYLKRLIKSTELKIKDRQYRFTLPNEIVIIKSAMHEEGGANGFTRENYIVLNLNSLSQHLFEHELFHIISRYNPEKVEKAYNILGFSKCNEIKIPSPFTDLKITNPDAPFNNFYINLKYNEKDIEAIMLLYSKKNYSGGRFFSYLTKGLLLIEGKSNKKVIMSGGTPVILTYDEVDNLFQQIGTNTGYNIHPEEITSDHFIMALNKQTNLPNQNLVDQLTSVLKE